MSMDTNKKIADSIVTGNTSEEERINEESQKELLLGIKPKSEPIFLGVCSVDNADVFANQPHVEVTTVFSFGDGTARTITDYIHMNCYKFGGSH
jgi:hypothetical protein